MIVVKPTPQLRSLLHSLAPVALILVGCASQPPERATLAQLDQSSDQRTYSGSPIAGQIADGDAKSAYYQFLDNAPGHDVSRNQALARLAELELKESERWTQQDDYQEDQRYRATLERTIELLSLALAEFPDAPGNDRKLYQLAKSYDMLGQYEPSLRALEQLANEHPESELFPEAQFRLAEAAFSAGDYLAAEIAYTAALYSSQDTGFHERALFKRGWSRYKQSLYEPALEDFIAVIHAQEFLPLAEQFDKPLASEQQVVYDEYYRSFALAMQNYAQPDNLVALFKKHGLKDLYAPFHASAQQLEAQERISDAVAQWQRLIDADPEPLLKLRARTHIVSLWQTHGFTEAGLAASDAAFDAYRAYAAQRGKGAPTNALERRVEEALRSQWTQVARYYHGRYQQNAEPSHLAQAQQWYERYLNHFSGYAQQDGIALAYGDLLSEAGRTDAAFEQYERAAFDGSVILNQEAAYAALALVDELTADDPKQWLPTNLRYAQAFAQLYPNDPRTPSIAWQAARHAFNAEAYDQAIELAVFAQTDPERQNEAYSLTLQSHLNEQRYAQAEQVARQLLSLNDVPPNTQTLTQERWALAVYRQAELAEQQGDRAEAIRHYRRIHESYPDSDNAARGLYNALSLAGEMDRWDEAIALIQRFQNVYPDHSLRADAERQLSTAYLASGQNEQAARQYERLANSEQDGQAQRAAQWKAAQLYLEQNDHPAAINAFRRYAHSYPTPYPENVEAMNHLVTLYTESGEANKRRYWQQKIVRQDRQQPDQVKTDRSRRLAATAALGLGRDHHERFRATRLSLPLDQSLATKTGHMQNAIQQYARAASYGLSDVASESTHQIGRIYETLARDLLDSDRPAELSGEALMQYNILLEDRAFPFEDKAIEFYERNLRRAQSESFNPWLAKSRERLTVLFPVRYDRPPRAEVRFTQLAPRDTENSAPVTSARLEEQ